MSAETDMLRQMLQMQEELNDGIFRNQGIRDHQGNILTMAKIREEVAAGLLGPNDLPNVWLGHYLDADKDENRELGEALHWKWWSRDTLDLQNIRVEIVDKLHFFLSLVLIVMAPEELFRLYCQKYEVNRQRQQEGYSRDTKTEDDNRGIT